MSGGLVLVLAGVLLGAAHAAVSELNIVPTPAKQPRWVYGTGALQITAWSSGYTSWGTGRASGDR